MQVETTFDASLGVLLVAGTPAAARMTATIERAALPEDLRLWVTGLFPLISEADLHAFADSARASGSARWSSERGGPEGLVATFDADGDQSAHREKAVAFSDRPLLGVNDPASAATAAQAAFRANARAAASAGAILMAPDQTWLEDEVSLEAGAILEPNVYIGGKTRIASGVQVGMGAHIRDTRIAAGAQILPYCVIASAIIGSAARVGPFAHLRPGTELGEEVRVGNFVETKKTKLAKGAKASHLTYLGDAVVGEDANIGAGTITCNYDGYNKHQTEIGAGVFVGSNSQLVAPVRLGDGAYVAAGSTVTNDVEADALVIARSRQVVKKGMAAVLRESARAEKES